MPYELIEHTADVGIHSYGDDLEEAFAHAAKGMFSIITDVENVEPVGEYKVELERDGWDSLLVAFLSELIFLHETEDILLSEFDVTLEDKGGKRIICLCGGEKRDEDKHEMDTAVKGVSYHDLHIDIEGDIRVLFDV